MEVTVKRENMTLDNSGLAHLVSHRRFSARRCNLCSTKDLSKKIQLCSGCRLVYYCGVEHQKLDYTAHKNICVPIRTVYKEQCIQHMLELHGPIENRCQLHKTVTSFKVLIMTKRKKPLDWFEEDILTFPRCCEFCFKHNSKNLFDCDNCGEVSYCSKDHQYQHLEKHGTICTALKIYYNSFDAIDVPPLTIKSTKNLFSITTDLPTMMWKILEIDCSHKEPKTNEEYCKFSAAAKFSCAATVLYGTRILSNICDNIVTVIFVGVFQESHFFAKNHCEFLISQMPQVEILNLVFVGPEMNSQMEDCFEFNGGLVVKREFYTCTIQDFISNRRNCRSLLQPKLIVCFNCGFGEHFGTKDDTWGAGIKVMLRVFKAPIIFTSYTKKEAHSDAEVIKKCAADINMNIKIINEGALIQNPFKDFRPLRNGELDDEEDLMYYRNGYLQIAIPNTCVVASSTIQDVGNSTSPS